MKQIFLVGIGGFCGAVLRYKVSGFMLHHFDTAKFSFGTLTANLVGCLLIGLLSGLAEKRGLLSAESRLLLITGFLGGFTTFSSFEYETFFLLRRGQMLLALAGVAVSVFGGLFAVWLGWQAAGAAPPVDKLEQMKK